MVEPGGASVNKEGAGKPEGARRKPRPRRRRRPARPAATDPGLSDLERQAEKLRNDLRELLMKIYQERAEGQASSKELSASLDVIFSLELSKDANSPDSTPGNGELDITIPSAKVLLSDLKKVVDEIATEREVFRAGHVHCFWCQSSACEHSLPPGEAFVFTGYSPTGLPEWEEFPAWLLARKDERVESLYRRPPALIPSFVRGSDLKANQLRVFGRASRSYNILAQVAAGFLRIREPESGESRQVAFTLQAVETRGKRGDVRLDMNLVGVVGDGKQLADVLSEAIDDRLARVLHSGTKELKELESLIRQAGRARKRKVRRSTALLSDDLERVASIVTRMEKGLSRIHRQRTRRTKHAEDHGVRGGRPIAKAQEDVRGVDPSKILLDRRTGAFIVLGPRSRVHVFSAEGKHVTSLNLTGDKVERRMVTKRWRPASRVEGRHFLSAIEERESQDEES